MKTLFFFDDIAFAQSHNFRNFVQACFAVITVPSLADIQKMRDPVLMEIFRDSDIDVSGRARSMDDPPPMVLTRGPRQDYGE